MIKRFIKLLFLFLYMFLTVAIMANAQESPKETPKEDNTIAVSQAESDVLKQAVDIYRQNLFTIQSLDRAIASIQSEKAKAEKDRDNALLIFQNNRLRLASEKNVDLKVYELEAGKDGLFRFIRKPDKKEDKK